MQEAFGVFIIGEDDPNLVFALDILPSEMFLDYEVHIIEAGRQHLVITRAAEPMVRITDEPDTSTTWRVADC